MILYTDKTELFECNVSVDGASIENTRARLVVEGKKWNLVFYGNVENNGKCKIDIGNLNIFNEGDSGKIKLEVIADDTIFTPWEDSFQVKTNKKVTVEILSNNANPLIESKQNKIAINVQVPQKDTKTEILKEISSILKQKNISLNNINENKSSLMNVILKCLEKHKMISQENVNWVADNISSVLI